MAPTALTALAASAILGAAAVAFFPVTAAAAAGGSASTWAPGALLVAAAAAGAPTVPSPWTGLGTAAAGAPAAVAAAATRRTFMAAPPPLRSAVGHASGTKTAARRATTAAATAAVRGGARAGALSSTSRQASLPPRMLPGGRSIYVNCGGAFTIYDGVTWETDRDGGAVPADSAVFGTPAATALPVLLRTNRYSPRSMTFTRRVAAASTYRLTLHWAEIFVDGPGVRIMDVFVAVDGRQPVEMAAGLDVYAVAGNATPYALSYPPPGADAMYVADTVAIYLQPSLYDEASENPFLSAFRVVEETPAPTPTPDTTAEGDPAEIGELLREAAAIADVAIPARVAAAGYLTDKADALAVADSASEQALRLYNAAVEAAPVNETSPLGVAYDAIVDASGDVRSVAAALTGDAFRTAAASVASELAALRDAAAALTPTVCAYLTGATATGGGLTDGQLAALDERVTYVELAVERLLRELAADRTAAEVVEVAVDRLVGRVARFRTLAAEAADAAEA